MLAQPQLWVTVLRRIHSGVTQPKASGGQAGAAVSVMVTQVLGDTGVLITGGGVIVVVGGGSTGTVGVGQFLKVSYAVPQPPRQTDGQAVRTMLVGTITGQRQGFMILESMIQSGSMHTRLRAGQ